MFGNNKTKCGACQKEISKKFDYCPFCASPLKDLKKEYGLLGRSDDFIEREINKNFDASFPESIINKMISSAVKMLNTEIKKTNEIKFKQPKIENPRNSNFELYINGKKINLPGDIAGVQIEKMPFSEGGIKKPKRPKAKIPRPRISEEILERSKKLPRKEAESHVSRTSDKIFYELKTPGLNSPENVLINKLENSLEIKAFTEKAVYFKVLPGKLPLIQYSVSPGEGKLILEFKAQ